jgi:hypothetical protein
VHIENFVMQQIPVKVVKVSLVSCADNALLAKEILHYCLR